VPGSDPTHWLHRLTSEEWLAAADTELHNCEATLARRAVRPGVTHARRAAGMSVNAVLVLAEDEHFGRSYMDHVVALTSDEQAPPDVRAAAQFLRETPPAPPALITLGKPDMRVLDEARRIVDYATRRVARLRAVTH
jgi:HEPN domain-containing protein